MVFKSGITKIEPNHIVSRGYRQEELIGNVPFPSVVFLLLRGRLPTPQEGRMMDAILTSSIDHGMTSPSALAARVVASSTVPLPTAVAAGVLAIGDTHGGAIENAARLFQEKVREMQDKGVNPEEMGRLIVESARAERKRIPGFGHRYHTEDPRTKRLYKLAEELGIAGPHIALAKGIEKAFADIGKKLPTNVDGAIAAIISDMGFDYRLGKAFFYLGRIAGLTAQVYEEITREKPMRRFITAEVEYDGPWERDLKGEVDNG